MHYFIIPFLFFMFIEQGIFAQQQLPPESCQTKESERAWYNYLSKYFHAVFPDGQRNYGGHKWFEFCETQFWQKEDRNNESMKKRMQCCTHSYCPYSGAIAGGAAKSLN